MIKISDLENFEDFKKELLSDPKVKAEYDRLGPQYDLIRQVLDARIKKKISQKQLAKKIGTKQSAISRFEGGNTNPTLSFIQKLACALKTPIKITIAV
jgi:ribosome-binding protein aMBF1 (putative translation factor)